MRVLMLLLTALSIYGAENVTTIAGATPIRFYLRNYTYDTMSAKLPSLSFGLATDVNRLMYKNASGTMYKLLTDASTTSNTAAGRIFFADANGAATGSDSFTYDDGDVNILGYMYCEDVYSGGALYADDGIYSSSDVGGVSVYVDSSVYTPAGRMTPEGGYAVLLTNRTGGPSVKGEVVTASSGYDNSVSKIVVDVPSPIGVFYNSGVADGQPAWVVVSGVADVYFVGSTTRGHLARGFVTGDVGYVSGQAISEAVPSPPFATDKHFYEMGHVLETRTGAGLAKCILHFN